jgi:hypothetical protein
MILIDIAVTIGTLVIVYCAYKLGRFIERQKFGG